MEQRVQGTGCRVSEERSRMEQSAARRAAAGVSGATTHPSTTTYSTTYSTPALAAALERRGDGTLAQRLAPPWASVTPSVPLRSAWPLPSLPSTTTPSSHGA